MQKYADRQWGSSIYHVKPPNVYAEQLLPFGYGIISDVHVFFRKNDIIPGIRDVKVSKRLAQTLRAVEHVTQPRTPSKIKAIHVTLCHYYL